MAVLIKVLDSVEHYRSRSIKMEVEIKEYLQIMEQSSIPPDILFDSAQMYYDSNGDISVKLHQNGDPGENKSFLVIDYDGYQEIPVGNQVIDLMSAFYFKSTPDQDAEWTTVTGHPGHLVWVSVDNTAEKTITFGAGFTDVIAITEAGMNTKLLYYDRTTWREISLGGGESLPALPENQVYRGNAGNVAVATGSVLIYEGDGIKTIDDQLIGTDERLTNTIFCNIGSKPAASDYPIGTKCIEKKGGTSEWTLVANTLNPGHYITGLLTFSVDNKIYACTDSGALYQFSGSAWVEKAPAYTTGVSHGIIEFDDKIYMYSNNSSVVYEWTGTDDWNIVSSQIQVQPGGADLRFVSAGAHNGKLYFGDNLQGQLYEWNGVDAVVLKSQNLGWGAIIYDIAHYDYTDKLYASIEIPIDEFGNYEGRLYEWDDVDTFVEVAPNLADVEWLVQLIAGSWLYGIGRDYQYVYWDDDELLLIEDSPSGSSAVTAASHCALFIGSDLYMVGMKTASPQTGVLWKRPNAGGWEVLINGLDNTNGPNAITVKDGLIYGARTGGSEKLYRADLYEEGESNIWINIGDLWIKCVDNIDLASINMAQGDLTAGSSKIIIGGTGTDALIGDGATIDIDEAEIDHNALYNLQGGNSSDEYYHLAQGQYDNLTFLGIDNYDVLVVKANADFTDSSFRNHDNSTTASIDTVTKKFGAGSAYFERASSEKAMFGIAGGGLNSSPYFTVSDSDFTLSGWVYFDAVNVRQGLINWSRIPTVDDWSFYFDGTTNKIGFLATTGGVTKVDVDADWSPDADTWYFVSCCRYGDIIYIAVDGTQLSPTGTQPSGSITEQSGLVILGNTYGTGDFLDGYLDDVRFSVGIARYTENYTIPSKEIGSFSLKHSELDDLDFTSAGHNGTLDCGIW